ncbi:MAG: sulfatase-like hydrolase/transferase, partial [Myxococcota bacterium]
WREIAVWCLGGTLLYAIPHFGMRQGVLERPIEVVYFEEALGFEGVRLDSEEEAFGQLRTFIGLPPGRVWLDDRYPLVHGPDPAAEPPPAVEDPPDIVLILIESMRAECFDFIYPNAQGCEVPYLERLAREGVVFPRFIANGFPSSEGFMAVTTSSWPHHRKRVIADYQQVRFDSLPERLADMGYYTLAAEPNAGFDSVGPWYDRFFHDRIDLVDLGFRTSEKKLFELVRERIEAHDEESPGQPLYLQIKTENPHLPYGTPRDDGSRHLEGDSLLDHYRATMSYVDEQIASLLNWMETRPRGDNMVIVVTGDHANYLDQKDTTALPLNHTAWVGAWIHGPDRWIGPSRRIDDNLSHVDLLPTVLALVGDHRPSASIGRNMLGPGRAGAGTAVMVRPGGFRMDRKDRALIVDRKRPGVPIEYAAFPSEPTDVAQAAFGAEDLDRLWDSVMTFSFLIEQDRLWDQEFLAKPKP